MDRVRETENHLDVFDDHQFVLAKRHYYLPFPDKQDIASIGPTQLIGCDIDEAACFDFHARHVLAFDPEFREFPTRAPSNSDGYGLVNGAFMAVDGNLYYGLIRSLAPRKIIEIGSGNSTKLACAAIRKNIQEGRDASKLVCIEPFHSTLLADLAEVTEVRTCYVQQVPLAEFEALDEGDILFIDSTHTVRPGGDVWWEICEILPRLKSGVLVHLHDISLPNPYPRAYLERRLYWMEQYMLQAYLCFNSKVSVVWAGNWLMLRNPQRMQALFGEELQAMCSEYPAAEPASFWLRVN
ncbi:MAG: class I SAM-dependent methyltransferase [Pseudomarimonas sp.]